MVSFELTLKMGKFLIWGLPNLCLAADGALKELKLIRARWKRAALLSL